MNPVVVVHGGGASNISKDRKERVRQGIVKAATEGYAVLQAGGSAVDAVERAVTVLEDDPEFNAGSTPSGPAPRTPEYTGPFRGVDFPKPGGFVARADGGGKK